MDHASPAFRPRGNSPQRALSFIPRRILRRLPSETHAPLHDFHRAVGRFCALRAHTALHRRASIQRLLRHLCPADSSSLAEADPHGRAAFPLGRFYALTRDASLRGNTQRWAALLYNEIKRLRQAGCDTATCLHTLIGRVMNESALESQPKRTRLWDAMTNDGTAQPATQARMGAAASSVFPSQELFSSPSGASSADSLANRATRLRQARSRSARDEQEARNDDHQQHNRAGDEEMPAPKFPHLMDSLFMGILRPQSSASLHERLWDDDFLSLSYNPLQPLSRRKDEQQRPQGDEDKDDHRDDNGSGGDREEQQ